MEEVTIILLRRDPETLSLQEVDALRACFSGKKLNIVRTDPRDYMEHDEQCRKLGPAAVILPMEKPIPSAAMERGVPHIAWLPTNTFGRLKPLVPDFDKFCPGKESK